MVVRGGHEELARWQSTTSRVLGHGLSFPIHVQNPSGDLAIDEELMIADADFVSPHRRHRFCQEANGSRHILPLVNELAYGLGDREGHEITAARQHARRNPIYAARNARCKIDEQMPRQRELSHTKEHTDSQKGEQRTTPSGETLLQRATIGGFWLWATCRRELH
jgi:hypothetical protein